MLSHLVYCYFEFQMNISLWKMLLFLFALLFYFNWFFILNVKIAQMQYEIIYSIVWSVTFPYPVVKQNLFEFQIHWFHCFCLKEDLFYFIYFFQQILTLESDFVRVLHFDPTVYLSVTTSHPNNTNLQLHIQEVRSLIPSPL